jgi:hypothetical protein
MAFKVGEDIDAWCTKCRTDTLHVVVALKPGVSEPKRVECKECHGQHMYHAPKIGAPKQAAAAPVAINPHRGRSHAAQAGDAAGRIHQGAQAVEGLGCRRRRRALQRARVAAPHG